MNLMRWIAMLAAIAAVLGVALVGAIAWFLKHPRE